MTERQLLINELQDTSVLYLSELKKGGSAAFGSLGLSYGQAMLLTFIERGYNTPTELVDLLGIVRPALSTLITQLAATGLVKRQEDGNDNRRVIVALTPKGRNACLALRQAWREYFPLDLSRFSDRELRVLVEAARIATRQESI